MIRDEFQHFLEDGIKFLDQKDFQEAIRNFELALEKSYMMGSDKDSLIVNEYLGKVYHLMHNIDRAIEYYKENLTLYMDLKDAKGIMRTLNKIALILFVGRKYKEALEYHMRCLEICRNVGNKHGEAVTLKNIGMIHSRLGNHVLALKAHTASLDIKRNLGDRRGEALSLYFLGQSQIDAGKFDLARKNLQAAGKILKNLGLKADLKKVNAEIEELDKIEEEFELELEITHRFHNISKDDFLFK